MLLCVTMVWIIIKHNNSKERNIRSIIKTHNEINNTNAKFPVISKPSSSSSTVFAGDSIRIMPIE